MSLMRYYADDTIIVSSDKGKLQKHLQNIEKIGREYGMKLNKEK